MSPPPPATQASATPPPASPGTGGAGRRVAPYGTWRSAIAPEVIIRAQVGLGQPLLTGGTLHWTERRPDEGGRVTLMRQRDDEILELTTAPFNVRTRVHEYGGAAYTAEGDVVVAANFADQRLYRIRRGTSPEPLTPDVRSELRYADPILDRARNRLIAVREDHRSGSARRGGMGVPGEPRNQLVAIPLHGGEGEVIDGAYDFVAAPALSPDGRQLAWIAWNHPDMPWDATTLRFAEIDSAGTIGPARDLLGSCGDSILQPAFSPDGALFFLSDQNGFWNLYEVEDIRTGAARAVCPMSAECGGPLWALGTRWFGILDPGTILALVTEQGRWRACRIARGTGAASPLSLSFTTLADIRVEAGRAVFVAGAPDQPTSIIEVAPNGSSRTCRTSGDLPVAPAWISKPEDLTFPTPAGPGHAFLYLPANPDFEAPPSERPPLIVKCHGGPTSMASTELRLGTQFWTSRGFAVLDVNYGGSSGFGRPYRERLAGRWGEVDVDDAIAAARAVVAKGLADPERLIISGGSAGGFTVLAALTFHDVFKAGASHYGVADLEALARETHKFESRYLDRLIGPYPETRDLYRARSPVHHVGGLSCPVIFFQGLDDRVVPPDQARAMVGALRARGLPVAYLPFEGEQHGFRRADTIRIVLQAELEFYGRIFGFEPADGWADLGIENLPGPGRTYGSARMSSP